MAQAITDCLARHVLPDQEICVAYSGGLDSTVLLHALHALRAPLVRAIHVHHGLNPRADAWLRHCETFCSALGVTLDVRRVCVPPRTGEGLEAAARRVRYQSLDTVLCDWVALAHHANDQAETLLHHLLRGTGVRGAAGMPERRGRYLRPLLHLPRREIETYARSRGMTWVEDDSNLDYRHARNFLRGAILPELTARYPAAIEQLAAAARRFGEADALLQELARIDLQGAGEGFPVPLQRFKAVDAGRGANLLRALLGWHGVQSPGEARLREFLRQLRESAQDRHPRLELTAGELFVGRGQLHFRPRKTERPND